MATPTTKKEIELAVVHLLAETGDSLSVKDLSDTLGVKAPLINRAVFEAKRATPQMIDIDPKSGGSRYIFVGDKDFLDPLPESIDIGIKIPAKAKTKAKTEPSAPSAKTKSKSLTPEESAILVFLKGKKKEAASSIYEEMEHTASIAKVDDALKSLESKGALKRQNVPDFDEDVIELTPKGREMIPAEAPKVDVKAKKSEPKAAKPTKKAAGAKAKGPGRPAGERDFGALRRHILEYVDQNPGQTKTEVGKILSAQMENFGRMSIAEEFMKLVKEGKLVPFKGDDGKVVPNRYQIPSAKKSAPKKAAAKTESKAPQKKVGKPVEKAPAAASKAAEKPSERLPEAAESGGYAPPAEVPAGFTRQEVDSLKAEMARVDTGSDSGRLVKKLEAYVQSLEDKVEDLEESNGKLRDMLQVSISKL